MMTLWFIACALSFIFFIFAVFSAIKKDFLRAFVWEAASIFMFVVSVGLIFGAVFTS